MRQGLHRSYRHHHRVPVDLVGHSSPVLHCRQQGKEKQAWKGLKGRFVGVDFKGSKVKGRGVYGTKSRKGPRQQFRQFRLLFILFVVRNQWTILVCRRSNHPDHHLLHPLHHAEDSSSRGQDIPSGEIFDPPPPPLLCTDTLYITTITILRV